MKKVTALLSALLVLVALAAPASAAQASISSYPYISSVFSDPNGGYSFPALPQSFLDNLTDVQRSCLEEIISVVNGEDPTKDYFIHFQNFAASPTKYFSKRVVSLYTYEKNNFQYDTKTSNGGLSTNYIIRSPMKYLQCAYDVTTLEPAINSFSISSSSAFYYYTTNTAPYPQDFIVAHWGFNKNPSQMPYFTENISMHNLSLPAVEHNLTVNYVYEDGSQAAESVTQSVASGAAYNIASPSIIGYTADQAAVTGTMPEDDLTITVTYTKNAHELKISYKLDDGTQAAPPVVKRVAYGEAYSVQSPELSGLVPNRPVVDGTMPDNPVEAVVVYTRNKHTLSVRYVYVDGSEAAPTYTETVAYGLDYSVDSPVIDGYSADKPSISGVMPDKDVEETVTYSKDLYTLTIHYVYEDGSKAADDVVQSLAAGSPYTVASPSIPGYISDLLEVSGEMPARNLELTVTYAQDMYTLTVRYLFRNGQQAAKPVVQLHPYGRAYSVVSPTITGYEPDKAVVEGDMPMENLTVTVTYAQGSSGGGGSGGGDGSSTNPFERPQGEWSGSNPFERLQGEWSGSNPFVRPQDGYSGTNPFIRPQQGEWSGTNPFERPTRGS